MLALGKGEGRDIFDGDTKQPGQVFSERPNPVLEPGLPKLLARWGDDSNVEELAAIEEIPSDVVDSVEALVSGAGTPQLSVREEVQHLAAEFGIGVGPRPLVSTLSKNEVRLLLEMRSVN